MRYVGLPGQGRVGHCTRQCVSTTVAAGNASNTEQRVALGNMGTSKRVHGTLANDPIQELQELQDHASMSRVGQNMHERDGGVSRRTALLSLLSTACLLAGPVVRVPPSARAAARDTDVKASGALRGLGEAERAEVLAALEELIPPSKAPLMLRLVFHDGATYRLASKDGGVNGSIQYELDRPENFGLKRGTNVIKQLQGKLPAYSFADLVVLAAAYAVKITNGPDLFPSLRVGRRDVAGPDPEGRMPEESLSAAGQVEVFGAMGFSVTEMVALLGSHTIGQKGFGGPLEFDNVYYQSLLKRPWENKDDKMASMIGLASDRVLPDLEETKVVIERFAGDQAAFFREFEKAFIKLSELGCDV